MGYDSEEFQRGFPPAPKGNSGEIPGGSEPLSQPWTPSTPDPSTPYVYDPMGTPDHAFGDSAPPPPPGSRGTQPQDNNNRRRNIAIGAAAAVVLITCGTLGYVLFGGANGSPQQSAVSTVVVATDTATPYPPTSTSAPGQPTPTPYPPTATPIPANPAFPTATPNPHAGSATVTFTRSTQAISVSPTLTVAAVTESENNVAGSIFHHSSHTTLDIKIIFNLTVTNTVFTNAPTRGTPQSSTIKATDGTQCGLGNSVQGLVAHQPRYLALCQQGVGYIGNGYTFNDSTSYPVLPIQEQVPLEATNRGIISFRMTVMAILRRMSECRGKCKCGTAKQVKQRCPRWQHDHLCIGNSDLQWVLL